MAKIQFGFICFCLNKELVYFHCWVVFHPNGWTTAAVGCPGYPLYVAVMNKCPAEGNFKELRENQIKRFKMNHLRIFSRSVVWSWEAFCAELTLCISWVWWLCHMASLVMIFYQPPKLWSCYAILHSYQQNTAPRPGFANVFGCYSLEWINGKKTWRF